MPKKTYKKKTYKKKAWRRKPYGIYPNKEQALAVTRRASIFSGRGVGIGRQLTTTLKTVFFKQCTADANGMYTGYLEPGSCYDPTGDQSAIQPTGFDELRQLFARYVVKNATVKITIAMTSGGAAGLYGIMAAAYPSTLSAAKTTFQGYAGQPFAQYIQLSPTGEPKSMKWFLDAAAVVGRTLPVTAEDNGALVGNNPTVGQSICLPFFIQAMNAAAANFIFTMSAEITQTVVFDQRIQVEDA